MLLSRVANPLLGIVLLAATPALGGQFCFDVDLPIPDNGQVVHEVGIDAGGKCPVIDDLNVFLDIGHTRVGDLRISLEYNPGTTPHTEVLLDRPGVPDSESGCEGDDVFAWIDDEGDVAAEFACFATPPAISGSVIGGDPPDSSLLNAFTGDSPCGGWKLTVEDQAEGDTGILNTWCFDYTVAPDPDVPASGNPAAVALAVLMLALLGTRVLRRT